MKALNLEQLNCNQNYSKLTGHNGRERSLPSITKQTKRLLSMTDGQAQMPA